MFVYTANPSVESSGIFRSESLKEVEDRYIKDICDGILDDLSYAYRGVTLKVTDEHLLKLIIRSRLVNRYIISIDDNGKMVDLTGNYSKRLVFKNMAYRGVSILFKDDSVIPYGNWHECFIDKHFLERIKLTFDERNPNLGGVEDVSVSGINGSTSLGLSFPNKETLDKLLACIKKSLIYKVINSRG